MPVQAYLVPILTLIALIGGVLYMFLQAWRARPKVFYSGIGVLFRNGADESQPGIPEACETIVSVIRETYPDEADKLLKRLWIEFHGKNAVITSSSIPTGTVYREGGVPTILMGTCDAFRPTMFSPLVYVAKARQTYGKDGSLRTVGATAIFHEIAEHIVPFRLTGDWNADHEAKWKALSRWMDSRYKLEMGGIV